MQLATGRTESLRMGKPSGLEVGSEPEARFRFYTRWASDAKPLFWGGFGLCGCPGGQPSAITDNMEGRAPARQFEGLGCAAAREDSPPRWFSAGPEPRLYEPEVLPQEGRTPVFAKATPWQARHAPTDRILGASGGHALPDRKRAHPEMRPLVWKLLVSIAPPSTLTLRRVD